jgi:hypothetical protein
MGAISGQRLITVYERKEEGERERKPRERKAKEKKRK